MNRGDMFADVIEGSSFPREQPIGCPLCGGENAPRLIQARFGMTASVAYCDPCDLGYQTPRPSEDGSAAYMNYRWRSSDHYVTDNDSKRAEARRQLRLIGEASSLIDFGAGSGAFVRTAIDRGIAATGVEQSRSAIDRARQFYDVELLPSLPQAEVDLITMWDVIEHLRDPVETLRSIRARLKPGGRVIMETGNYESWQRTFAGDSWGLYLLDHQFYFTPASLRRLTELAGFRSFRLLDVGHLRPSVRPWGYDHNPVRWLGAWWHYWRAMRRWPDHGDIGLMVAEVS
jgi:SAM-dependent methyltransferase